MPCDYPILQGISKWQVLLAILETAQAVSFCIFPQIVYFYKVTNQYKYE